MVEDIITALSQIRWLFVTARNSSFPYKACVVDVKQVGRELGVRYVLEGSVRKAGKRLRITAQLIEAATGAHLWADKIDGELQEIFELQDRITSNVVGIVAPTIEQAEIERAKHKPTERLDSYDLISVEWHLLIAEHPKLSNCFERPSKAANSRRPMRWRHLSLWSDKVAAVLNFRIGYVMRLWNSQSMPFDWGGVTPRC